MDARVKPAHDAKQLRLLLGDDLVLDAVVDVLRDDLLVHQIVLALVGAALDDRLVRGLPRSLGRAQSCSKCASSSAGRIIRKLLA